MYSGPQTWQPSTLDVNHDDYYGSAVPGCRDLANSDLLEPLPAGAEAPPGWPYAILTNLGCGNEMPTIPGPDGVDTQVTFVNAFTAADGAPLLITIWERVLGASGLYVRSFRLEIPYGDGAVLPAKENAVFVATANGSCAGIARATANPSRWLVER
jgi:hypothetical protein